MADNNIDSIPVLENSQGVFRSGCEENSCPSRCQRTLDERTLCEQSPAMGFVLRADLTIQCASRYACRQLGYALEEVLGQRFLELTHPSDRSLTSHLLLSSLRRPGETVQGESRKRRSDQSLLWVCERACASTGEDGVPVVVVAWEDITERRQAAVQIRDSQAQYGAIIEALDGHVYVCSADYRIEFMNRELIERTGRDATGELCYAALHNRTSICPWCVNDRILRGETVRWEVQSPRDGRWYYCVDTPIRHADGSISKQAIIQDITERKQNDQAQLRGITDSAQDAILMMDARGNISFWNPAAEKILGYTREEALGQNLHRLLVPMRYMAAHTAAFREFARTGQGPAVGRTLEMSARRKDGHEIDIDLSLSAVQVDGAWNAIGIVRDVTERKRAALALEQSEEKFRQLAENIREVFFVVDLDTRKIVYVSPAYEQIWERSCESLYRDPWAWALAVHPDDAGEARRKAATRFEGQPVSQEYRIRTPGGVEKWIRSRSFPVRDDSAQRNRVVGVAEEITEEKRYESELIRAREMAESANHAKSAFLATMSHELRTPLNAILGFAEFLELEMEEQKAEHWLEDIRKIRRAGSHLLDLISDVMDLSKIEAGKMQLEPSRFDAAAVVAEVAVSAEPLATKNNNRLSIESAPVEVLADRLRFRQCLLNLASNACKFTKNGEVRIEQSVVEREGRPWCQVRVVDNGIGIEAGDLEKIFEDFTQVDGSISRKYGGTGLGLPISRRLMHMMGGDITVESALGQGSAFTLWLPCACGPAAT